MFRDRGYRTAFVTPSDLDWADWRTFLDRRGFGEVIDHHGLPCSTLLSSWGVEDRCAVDGMIQFIEKDPARPFFLMAWSQQTHHPYEPTPGVPLLEFVREPVTDAYDLGRYLNVLHETDRHLERLFETIRRAGLEQDTLIVVTGDHGQAFGDPHDSYMQGRTVYEEDVNVPLLFWYPRLYSIGDAISDHRQPCRSGADDRGPRGVSGGARLAGAQPVRHRARAPRVLLRGRGSFHARRARKKAWSTSSICAEGSDEL